MKNIKATVLLMATALLMFLHQQAQAQTVLRQSVFGNGATAGSNGTYRLSGTAGQPLIGVTSSSSYIGKQGFWYSISNTGVPTENQPPYVTNPIPDQTLTVGAAFVRDLNAAPEIFSDPDGDVLSYSATSSDPSKATATVSGNTLTIAAVAQGGATITVTADDGKGGTVSTTFTVTVVNGNRPPVVANTIPSQTLTVGSAAFVRDLNATPTAFSDPDGDALSYSATSSDPSKATATVSGSTFTVAPVVAGSATITVIANDGKGGVAQTAFVVTVDPSPTYWTQDTFDPLNLGSLHGQNGWGTVAGKAPAIVLLSPSGAGKVMELKAPVNNNISMSKTVNAALSGTQTFELKVRVEQPNSASMAKLEVNTNNGTFWNKKFQIYFGSSMRLNNSPSTAVNFLSQTVPQQWYTVKVFFNLGTNLLDLYLDGVLVLNDVAIGAGAISGIAVTGFSKSPNYVLLDDILGYTGGLTKTTNQDAAAEPAETMPSSFELAQNYPNPFNPETTIQYAIPGNVSGPVRVILRVFNLQGQAVRTLVDQQKSPGRYRVVWDGKNDLGAKIATGVYLYTITAGDFKATKRMTVLK